MWHIIFTDKGLKALDKVDKSAQKRIRHYLEDRIAPDAFAHGEPMAGEKKGFWRYRVGDYRIIVKLLKDEVIVLVVQVGKRADVYRTKL